MLQGLPRGKSPAVPELPDVEGFRRVLARRAHGHEIVDVHVPDAQIVRNRTPRSLRRALAGGRFGAPRRHGKWLFAPVGDVELVMHFGMTGALAWSGEARLAIGTIVLSSCASGASFAATTFGGLAASGLPATPGSGRA